MKKLLLSISILFIFNVGNSQNQFANPVTVSSNYKTCVVKQFDGNFFVGGIFNTLLTPFANTKIAIVNNNISENYDLTNAAFGSPNYDIIYCVGNYLKGYLPKPDPTYFRYVGGDTGSYNGVIVNGFMRISYNGSLDPTFTLNNSTTPYNKAIIRSFAVQSDNKIVIGGFFPKYFNQVKNNITRLNENGTLDTTFNQNGTGFNGTVYDIKLQNDGKIIVGGDFTSYNGVPRKNILRLLSDGSLDATFNINYPLSDKVRTILVQADNKIVIGGDFSVTTYSDPNSPSTSSKRVMKGIIRLLSNGNIDYSFNLIEGFYKPFTYNNITTNEANVLTISQYANNKLFVGGNFDKYNSINRNNMCLLNADGTLDNSFNPVIGPDGIVYGSVVENDGNVVIVGGFYKYNNIIKNGIVRINNLGISSRGLNLNNSSETFSIKETKERINSIDGNLFNISPNPTKDYINVNIINKDFKLKEINLLSIEGKVLFSKSYQDTSDFYTLDLSSLSNGTYLISVRDINDVLQTSQIVKN